MSGGIVGLGASQPFLPVVFAAWFNVSAIVGLGASQPFLPVVLQPGLMSGGIVGLGASQPFLPAAWVFRISFNSLQIVGFL
ncbi:hypothetical protein CEXT_97561 [Caerostris extrusa]|uniref:Uncharacterized protein n=1 Tax=Caerostris extrusa TaxID=172846 RepID=A0AAV4PJC6_CAEEX|nr:hypothetical protein CEXT_97561 [Caerostris extrusa]